MIKIIVLSSIIISLFIGLALKSPVTLIGSSIVFAVCLTTERTYETVKASNAFKNGKYDGKINQNKRHDISYYLEGLIIVYGIVSLFINDYNTSGKIILWCTWVLQLIVLPIVASIITDIPIEFGHGGWKVKYRKSQRYRK